MRATRAILIALAVLASGCVFREESTQPPASPTTQTTPTSSATTPATLDLDANATANATKSPTNATGNVTRNASSSRRWPIEGSFVTYEAEAAWVASDGSRRTWTNATWRYNDGEWELSCDGVQEVRASRAGEPSTSPIGALSAGVQMKDRPPHVTEGLESAPRAPASLVAWTLHDCRTIPAEIRGDEVVSLDLANEQERNTTYVVRRGELNGARVWWDEKTGLLVAWEVEDRELGWRGRIVSTDAPVLTQ